MAGLLFRFYHVGERGEAAGPPGEDEGDCRYDDKGDGGGVEHIAESDKR